MSTPDPKPRGTFCGQTRREFFWEAGGSFTGLALSGLLDNNFFARQTRAADGVTGYKNPLGSEAPDVCTQSEECHLSIYVWWAKSCGHI